MMNEIAGGCHAKPFVPHHNDLIDPSSSWRPSLYPQGGWWAGVVGGYDADCFHSNAKLLLDAVVGGMTASTSRQNVPKRGDRRDPQPGG